MSEIEIEAAEDAGYRLVAHNQHMEERNRLIDAAREASRTFDQAVLAFGSAVFAGSIGFLKDVSPHPISYSLKWLAISWGLFSFGLLGVMLSFLFSHKACMFEIEHGAKVLEDKNHKAPPNRSSLVIEWCNYLCVGFLFLGLISWSVFAFENFSTGESTLNNPKVPPPAPTDTVKKGYVPPQSATAATSNTAKEMRPSVTRPKPENAVRDGYAPPRNPPSPPLPRRSQESSTQQQPTQPGTNNEPPARQSSE